MLAVFLLHLLLDLFCFFFFHFFVFHKRTTAFLAIVIVVAIRFYAPTQILGSLNLYLRLQMQNKKQNVVMDGTGGKVKDSRANQRGRVMHFQHSVYVCTLKYQCLSI